MEKWISEIYGQAIAKHEEYGLKDGMAIFYSPVINKPKILFVGDNPGGKNGSVHSKPPETNYYLNPEYDLAKVMYNKIFYTEKLRYFLKNSVIINRVFFQSPDTNVFQKPGVWGDMEKFCLPYVKTIIEKIEPEIIFAESIDTYTKLIYGLKGKFGKPLVPDKGKGLLRTGKINDTIIIGMKHPTSRFSHLSNNDYELISQKLSEIL